MMCGEAMQRKELFERFFKHALLSMAGDRVPNVRMCLSRVLRQHFSGIGGAFVFDPDVNQAVRILQKDKSVDVAESVLEIQTFPMNANGEAAEEPVADFVERMREAMTSTSTMASTMVASEVDLEVEADAAELTAALTEQSREQDSLEGGAAAEQDVASE